MKGVGDLTLGRWSFFLGAPWPCPVGGELETWTWTDGRGCDEAGPHPFDRWTCRCGHQIVGSDSAIRSGKRIHRERVEAGLS